MDGPATVSILTYPPTPPLSYAIFLFSGEGLGWGGVSEGGSSLREVNTVAYGEGRFIERTTCAPKAETAVPHGRPEEDIGAETAIAHGHIKEGIGECHGLRHVGRAGGEVGVSSSKINNTLCTFRHREIVREVNSSTNCTTPYSGYTTPHSGCTTPQSGCTTSHSRYTTPHSGYTTLLSGHTSPDSGYTTPHSGYTTPHSGHTSPDSGYISPHSGYTTPHSGDTTPHSGYTTPHSGGVACPNLSNSSFCSKDRDSVSWLHDGGGGVGGMEEGCSDHISASPTDASTGVESPLSKSFIIDPPSSHPYPMVVSCRWIDNMVFDHPGTNFPHGVIMDLMKQVTSPHDRVSQTVVMPSPPTSLSTLKLSVTVLIEQGVRKDTAVRCWLSSRAVVMPGVLKSISHSVGSHTIGKMDFCLNPEILHFNDDDALEFDEELFNLIPSTQSTQSTTSTDGPDSDSELPDEKTVNLLDCFDSDNSETDLDISNNYGDCNGSDSYKYRVSHRQDPFMGLGQSSSSDSETSRPITTSNNPILTTLALDFEPEHFPQQDKQQTFSAWNPLPHKVDEESKNPLTGFTRSYAYETYDDDFEDLTEQTGHIFPDTPSPSNHSGTVTGDDSDVDIETVTDIPRYADSCGYATNDSSPALSPAASPAPYRGVSILHASSVNRGTQPVASGKSSGFVACGVSSSASLAENLMVGRTGACGKKRKLSPRDSKIGSKSPTQAYTHILGSHNNSVNFHDYAMSPEAWSVPSTSAASVETGGPTVFTKRVYKRKQLALDASDKEKQHHHNQLERNRRQKLADLFVYLREVVPKIAENGKASKVNVLNESTCFIRDLQRRHKKQEEDILVEEQRNEQLKRELRLLQSQILRK
ncbi:hypothetical protein Btru_014283 [Bulinus truncatus]|nr:hypothetical protein Btru_014283 [Bulinus truncatus]